MKKIIFLCLCMICLITGFIFNASKKNTSKNSNDLVVSCNAKVDFEIRLSEQLTHMEGHLSLTTLGSKRMAILYTGRLATPEGRFILSRTLLLHYQYHPENSMLELNYDRSIVSELDTVPDDVFYNNLMKSKYFILNLSRFSNSAWIVSGLTTPLYICNDS